MAYLDTVRTAKQVVADLDVETWGGTDVDADAKARAHAEGVREASFIDYAEALTNYESRDDVETLAHRRARDIGDQFSDADFTRAEDYDPFA